MSPEEIIALLNAPGCDDVHVSVQRYGADFYRGYECGRIELAVSASHASLQIGDEMIDFHAATVHHARDVLRDLRRLLNDPRVVAELERREVRTLRSVA